MAALPTPNYDIFPEVIKENEQEEFEVILASIELTSLIFWSTILQNEKNAKIFNMLVYWVISLRMGILKVKEKTRDSINLENALYSIPFLNIIPALMDRTSGVFKKKLQEQKGNQGWKFYSNVISICGPTGSGKSSICKKIIEKCPNHKIVKVITTRKGRSDDPTRDAVTEEEFEHLIQDKKLVYTEQYNGYWYGVRKEDIVNNIQEGYVSILDLPVGEGIKMFLATTKSVRSYAVTYADPQEAKLYLNKRAEISGEAKNETEDRINRVNEDMAFIAENINLFSKIVITKFKAGKQYSRFVESLAKEMI